MKKEKIKKVIYIGYAPLTIKTEKDFYLRELLDKRIEVEYWDVTDCFFPLLKLPDSVKRDCIKSFCNIIEFKKNLELEKVEEILIIPIIGFEWRSLYLYYLLNKFNCRIGFFARGMLPIYNVNLKTRILSKLHSLINPKKILRLLLNQIAYFIRKKSHIGHFEVIFTAGIVAERNFTALTNCIVRCNHFDYDETLMLEQNELVENKKYVVFLDEFLTGHPDFKMQKVNTICEINYFSTMNTFFKRIEEALGVEVFIASHPKANYDLEVFGGRKIIKYQTVDLVKNAYFIIAHVSTSIGLGVIYGKPILLTYTQELKTINPAYVSYIEAFGKALNCQVIEIDNFLLKNKMLCLGDVDIANYNVYLENYLTSNESKKIHTKQIFLNYLAKFEG